MMKQNNTVGNSIFAAIGLGVAISLTVAVLSDEFPDLHDDGGLSTECFQEGKWRGNCTNVHMFDFESNANDSSDIHSEKNGDLEGDFTRIPLEELEISPITWRDTDEPVTDNAFEVRIPNSVTRTLLDYCEQTGITDKFRELAAPEGAMELGTDEFHEFGTEEYPMTWFIQRPPKHWNSNMHWISPSDESSHEDYLRVLGEGGFDSVLNTIGEYLDLDGLVCYQLTFIGVSQCDDGYMHHDFNEVDGRAFNVIIPLILANNTPPELYIQSYDNDTGEEDRRGSYKYRIGAAAVIGDNVFHGTGRVDYLERGLFRLAATVYMADVNPDNVANVLRDYTQHFPPRDEDHLLMQAGEHWRPRRSLPKNPRGLITAKDGERNITKKA